MLVSEKQAKEKWCPFVRYSLTVDGVPVPAAFNRAGVLSTGAEDSGGSLNPPDCHCIASECMMWRWESGQMLGYCGLSGKGYIA